MRLRRLRLEHFRGIDACAVELLPEGTDCGITVIEGPNEAGKTSIADAVRLVFDYPHTSRHREIRALQPAGRDVPTTVRLELDHVGLHVSYTKTWNRDTGAQLSVRGAHNQDLAGKEAHARALELLGEMVDADLWRSLHMPQGQVAQPDIGGAAALVAALEGGDAPVPGGPGAGPRSTRRDGTADERDATVLAHVQRELGRWRSATGRDRRALTDLAARREALGDELDTAQQIVDAVAADLDEIAALRSVIPEQRAELTRTGTELAALHRRSERLEAQRAALERSDEVLAAARARAEVARQACERRRELVAEVEAAAVRVAARDEVEEEAVVEAGARQRTAEGALERAGQAVARCRDHVEAGRRRHELRRDRQQLAVVTRRRSRLTALDDRIAGLDARIAAAPVDDDALTRLRSAQAALSEAKAARTGGRAAVQITALADTAVTVAGQAPRPLSEGEVARIDLDGTESVTLGDIARLDLAPGPAQRRLTEAVVAAQQELDRDLGSCGVASLAEAEVAHAGLSAAVRDRSEAVAERTALAGLESYDDLDRRIQQLAGRLDGVPAGGGTCPTDDSCPTDDDIDAALRAVRRHEHLLQEAEAGYRDAAADRERARQLHEDLRVRSERQRIDQEVARQSLTAAQERLATQRASAADDELERRLADREAALAAALRARATAADALAQADDGTIGELRSGAQAAVQAATRRLADDERRLAALEAAVATRSDDGPVSRRDAIRRNLDRVSADLVRLRRRADAAELAAEVFERHRSERRRRYLSPLRDHIERLGRILWGAGFAVELDDDLQIRTRVLAGRALDYEQLSLGAREQLALISRLACAIVVGPAGAPIIVDDALGFSDPERLRRMGAVLSVAGRSTQLLLLTCHPQRYGHVAGARTVRLRGSKPGRSDPAAA